MADRGGIGWGRLSGGGARRLASPPATNAHAFGVRETGVGPIFRCVRALDRNRVLCGARDPDWWGSGGGAWAQFSGDGGGGRAGAEWRGVVVRFSRGAGGPAPDHFPTEQHKFE